MSKEPPSVAEVSPFHSARPHGEAGSASGEVRSELAASPAVSAKVEAAPKPAPSQSARRPKGLPLHLILPLLGAILGILLLLYPVVSTRLHNAAQQAAANSYTQDIQKLDPTESEKVLQAADEYNDELAQGLILDPFLQDVAPNSPQYQTYLKQLAHADAMGQVQVPSAGVNLPIYHGTFDDALQRGTGHLYGSSLPVGGSSSHTVITGHTGLQNMTLFDHLDRVKVGDFIYLNVYTRQLKYKVFDIRVVVPSDTERLRRVAGKDLITLVTCTPYGINSHRLLVTGERVEMDQKEAEITAQPKEINVPWEWWMIALVVSAAVAGTIIFGILLRLFLLGRKKRADEEEPPAEPAAD